MSLFDKMIVATIPLVPKPLVRHFADPYIAGETLEDAVRAVRQLNRQGATATVDVLGEAVTQREQSLRAVESYLELVETIETEGLDANVSIKPTQFGLGLDFAFCRDNYRRVLDELQKRDNFARIDMEDSPYTTLTFDLFDSLRQEYDKVGVVIQAYLRRSMHDLESRLIPAKAKIRICKGIYVEPPEIAFKDYEIVRRNFLLLLEKALKAGLHVGIATHDEILVFEAYRIIEHLELPPDRYEFQMLLGVNEGLRRQVIADGHKMRVYVPFGQDWYAYSTRRLKENPRIAGYVFRGIFSPN